MRLKSAAICACSCMQRDKKTAGFLAKTRRWPKSPCWAGSGTNQLERKASEPRALQAARSFERLSLREVVACITRPCFGTGSIKRTSNARAVEPARSAMHADGGTVPPRYRGWESQTDRKCHPGTTQVTEAGPTPRCQIMPSIPCIRSWLRDGQKISVAWTWAPSCGSP